MKKFDISENTMNILFNYLIQQKYKDVAELITMIQNDINNHNIEEENN